MQTHFKCRETQSVFDSYPSAYKIKLLHIRELIYEVAQAMNITDLEETLKWGEPSYLTKHGSAIRLAWHQSKPERYGVFFNCNTTLIGTFRELYQDVFNFEGNRSIEFQLGDKIAVNALKHCFNLSLNYHRMKHLPLLGV